MELNARRCKLSLSDYLRKPDFGYEVQVVFQKELYRIYKTVNYLGSDANNLSEEQIHEKLQDIKSKLLEFYLSVSQEDGAAFDIYFDD